MTQEEIRNQFEILSEKELVYFDNSAMTLKPKIVSDSVDYYNRYQPFNSGRGIYRLAFEVTSKVELTREKISKFFNCKTQEVIFTKNTTEGINMIALTFAAQVVKKGDEIIVSDLEHHSNFLPWLELAKKSGAKLVKIPLTENGRITVENFKKVLTNKTKFVALNFVSNTFGYVSPMKEIIKLSKEKNAFVLVDGSQATSHFKIDIEDLNCDFFVFSGYKMFAPTGVGVLIGKQDLLNQTEPLFLGGGMVLDIIDENVTYKQLPHKLEAGTLPIGDIMGLGSAVDFIEDIGFDYIIKKEDELKAYLFKELGKLKGVEVYNADSDLPLALFNVEGVHAHDAASMYDEFNVCVRAGNHCASLVNTFLSQIATIRVSLSFYNTKVEIDKFIFATEQIVKFFDKYKG